MTDAVSTPALQDSRRYTSVAIALHWAIAVLLIGNIVGGLVIDELPRSPLKFTAYQMHKTFGLTVLFLTLVRIGWRLVNPPPPLPAGMSGLERLIARVTHVAFYILMLAIPLSGWAMVSSSPAGVPTLLFNVLEWPHLPIAPAKATHDVFYEMHEYLAFGAAGLIGLHIAAALKHQFVNKDRLLSRMGLGAAPVTPSKGRIEPILLGVAALFGLIILLGALTGAPASGSAAANAATPASASEPTLTTLDSSAAPASTPTPASATGTGASAASAAWTIQPDGRELGFSGLNSGQPFTGVFKTWSAAIDFDLADPASARIKVTVDTRSAETGDRYNDETLPTVDWLDTANFPSAEFSATQARIVDSAAGLYALQGVLTLKGVSQPVSVPFTLAIDGDTATVTGGATLDRTLFAVGVESDAAGEWVSREIALTFAFQAVRS